MLDFKNLQHTRFCGVRHLNFRAQRLLLAFNLNSAGRNDDRGPEVQLQQQSSPKFRAARGQHAAVESGINALEVHGLDSCRDYGGIPGFKRYVALAVTGRNIQLLGVYLRRYEAALRTEDFLQVA